MKHFQLVDDAGNLVAEASFNGPGDPFTPPTEWAGMDDGVARPEPPISWSSKHAVYQVTAADLGRGAVAKKAKLHRAARVADVQDAV